MGQTNEINAAGLLAAATRMSPAREFHHNISTSTSNYPVPLNHHLGPTSPCSDQIWGPKRQKSDEAKERVSS
jgi:hypothetical protein